MTMKACTYHRVSTVDQDRTLAHDELSQAATARGYRIVLDIEETGSGARNDRPGLQQVLDAARRRKIDVVLVWKLDRFGRSALDLLHNVRVLEDAGVRFIAITQGIDIQAGGDPMSRLLLTMLGAIAEFERGLIIDRTKLGLAKARARGIKLGRQAIDVDLAAAQAELAAGVRAEVVAEKLGVSRATLFRRLQSRRTGPQIERSISEETK